jgi:hypothetical protein
MRGIWLKGCRRERKMVRQLPAEARCGQVCREQEHVGRLAELLQGVHGQNRPRAPGPRWKDAAGPKSWATAEGSGMITGPDVLRIGQWLLWRVNAEDSDKGAIWIQHDARTHDAEGGAFDEQALAELISAFYRDHF